MSRLKFHSTVVSRTLLLSAFLSAGVALAGAQTAAQADVPAQTPLAVQTPAIDTSHDSLFSSSADAAAPAAVDVASVHAVGPNFAEMMQYGGRQRYGRPRYRGGNTNADGSEKYTIFGGAGLAAPIGNTYHYDTLSYSFQGGVGRNFNKNFGVNVQFDWDNFGLQGRVLKQQAIIEDPNNQYGIQGNTDGYSHVWSFTLDPQFSVPLTESVGAYVIAGGGFYHKITTFTTPEAGTYCYYYCYTVVANEPYDSYTSNAGGVNAGFGMTYKFSRFSNERFYGEVRYVVVFNQQKAGINGSNFNNYASGNYNYPTYNLYPANSNRTTYLPVKFGIRF